MNNHNPMGAGGTYGVSMISPGRVVSQSMPAQTLPEATPEEQD